MIGKEGWQALGNALPSLTNIKELSLGENHLFFMNLQSVISWTGGCALDSDKAIPLFNALKHCVALNRLFLCE